MKKYIVCFVVMLSLLFSGPAKADIIQNTEEAATAVEAMKSTQAQQEVQATNQIQAAQEVEAANQTQAVQEVQAANQTQAVQEVQAANQTPAMQEVQVMQVTRVVQGMQEIQEVQTAQALDQAQTADQAQAADSAVTSDPGNTGSEKEIGPGITEAAEDADAGNTESANAGMANSGTASTKADPQAEAAPVPAGDSEGAAGINEQQLQPQGNRWGIVLNAEEKDLLARITMLEAGSESDLGQQAVVEVILNRVYSPVYPNTVYGVLSQVDGGYRQFTTWKSRNSRAAKPSARVWANMEAVLQGKTQIFPYETVYFSRKGENRRVQARIGGHVFCNR